MICILKFETKPYKLKFLEKLAIQYVSQLNLARGYRLEPPLCNFFFFFFIIWNFLLYYITII